MASTGVVLQRHVALWGLFSLAGGWGVHLLGVVVAGAVAVTCAVVAGAVGPAVVAVAAVAAGFVVAGVGVEALAFGMQLLVFQPLLLMMAFKPRWLPRAARSTRQPDSAAGIRPAQTGGPHAPGTPRPARPFRSGGLCLSWPDDTPIREELYIVLLIAYLISCGD